MKPLQILSLIFAILLLLPGVCFFGFGAAFSLPGGSGGGHEVNFSGMGPGLLLIGIVILGLAGLLFYFAFMKVAAPSAQGPAAKTPAQPRDATPPDDGTP